jgi:hypothetical protein
MARILKVGAGTLGIMLYVWFAAVKNVDRVKERKRSRHGV